MGLTPIPAVFSVVTWREMVSLQDFRGLWALDYELWPFFLIFILPFLLPVVLLRNFLVYRYTFGADRILRHWIIGVTGVITRGMIVGIETREYGTKVQIRWRTRRFGSTRFITVFAESLEPLGLGPQECALELRRRYLTQEAAAI